MNNYWRERERKTSNQYAKETEAYSKELNRIYTDMMLSVQKEIDSFYSKYALTENISIVEAKKRVDNMDVKAFERKAKKYVEEKNFSKRANDELKLYNLTMKINRLELLKSQIGLEMVSSYDEMQRYFEQALTERTLEEFKRQAGILGDIGNTSLLSKSIVNASFRNATFSERIWSSQTLLHAELTKLLETGLIQGKNPKTLARDLKKTFNVSRNSSERLMQTELARVQIGAQKASYEQNGFDQYEYVACHKGDVCDVCKALDKQHFNVKDMMPGENAPPMHPWCHCSTCAYLDESEYKEWLDTYGDHGLSYKEWQELTSINKHESHKRICIFKGGVTDGER